MKFLPVLIFLFTSSFSFSSSMKIGIFTDHKISSLWLAPAQGKYVMYGDGKLIQDLSLKSSVQLVIKVDSILVKQNNKSIGTYKRFRLVGKEAPNSFKIKPLSPSLPERIYDDNLEITIANKFFKFINRVNLDHYVAGVVESENGIKQNFEYYKTKAIICRTYALSNYRKHEAEGYELCDRVHCQVYKSKNSLNDDILMATVASTGVVIVDSDLQLITAAFHSNCGGQTVNSEDVWILPTSYLKSIKDTFCLRQPHAIWEHKVKSSEWTTYLAKYYNYSSSDTLHRHCILEYEQPFREADLINHDLKIPFKVLRNDFKLRSTYFNLEAKEDYILFKGKGYGHGIGLCQEGAMRMAELGYKYTEILHYYYKDVHLVDHSVLDFFREEN